MANRNNGDGGPLGFILDTLKELARQRMVLVLIGLTTGTTFGTRVGAPDRFTGQDGIDMRNEFDQKIREIELDMQLARVDRVAIKNAQIKVDKHVETHGKESEEWKRRIIKIESCCSLHRHERSGRHD